MLATTLVVQQAEAAPSSKKETRNSLGAAGRVSPVSSPMEPVPEKETPVTWSLEVERGMAVAPLTFSSVSLPTLKVTVAGEVV